MEDGFDWKQEIVTPIVLELHWNPTTIVRLAGKVIIILFCE